MLSKAPSNILTAGLTSLSLVIAIPIFQAVDNQKKAISDRISLVIAASLKIIAKGVEYTKDGTQRILKAKGQDLDAVHTTTYREFTSRIEEEIKKSDNHLTISQFETDVRFEDGEFVFKYKVNLNPARNANEAHRLVEMIGTVWCGEGAKEKVLTENKKIAGWQMLMRAAYPNMKIWYEIARSEHNSPKGFIFHEAVLAKGALQE